ncbi:Lon protease C-terminal proteolytic domain-containing protein [Melampsora americana]|nr:Lon protease C-terminal proteolytic domain-containing protein [Melampsora americana]
MLQEAQDICLKELRRLKVIPMASVEHSIIKNYLEIMLELPWTKSSLQDADMDVILGKGFLQKAKEQLNQDHYGMDHVKTRLIEFLAVIKRRADLDRDKSLSNSTESAKHGPTPAKTDVELADDDTMSQYANDLLSLDGDSANLNPESSPILKSITSTDIQPAGKPSQKFMKSHTKQKAPILLLVGPPGVGKTSIAKSIAKTLNKKFYRISLGGVKDESEIRGHRRTYVGSMPGVIVQALRRVGVNDPVILLDEIDKVGSHNFHGDPSAALLEVLDPEQNTSFVDHYINTPIDLSTVLFIATANSLDSISAPLLDRMETIKLNGYLFNEKMMIASRNLIPKQMKNYNLTSKEFVLDHQDVISKVILNYTRESGVRSLEREIGNLCRFKVMEFVQYQESCEESSDEHVSKPFDPRIHLDDLDRILGPAKYEIEMTEVQLKPGVAIGMAYQGSGNGSILFIEAQTYSGKGEMKLTGSLGDVIKESAELAISWIKNHAWELNLVQTLNHSSLLDQLDLHIHFPSGSIPKDGPSAGVGLVVCLVSLFGGISLDSKLAMTGEISLRGQVLPVGGIREKVLAAHRAGIKRIIMPSRNRKDVEGDEQVNILKRDIQFNFVSTLEEVIMIVFGEKLWEKDFNGPVAGEGKGKGEDLEARKVRFQKCLGSLDSLL